MALNKSITLKNNFNQDMLFNSTYCKVNQVFGGKENMSCLINVYDKKDGVVLMTNQYSFVPDLQGKNFIAQAYDHAKTMPEFEGAQDC